MAAVIPAVVNPLRSNTRSFRGFLGTASALAGSAAPIFTRSSGESSWRRRGSCAWGGAAACAWLLVAGARAFGGPFIARGERQRDGRHQDERRELHLHIV